MRFKEFLAELLQETELFEMAYSRKKAEQVIAGLSKPIFLHLIKILYYKDDVNYNKHISDLNDWLTDVNNVELKTKNKKPKTEDYWNWLYDEPYSGTSSLKRTINQKLKDYHNLETLCSINELNSKLIKVYTAISEEMSKDTFNDIESIINEL